jgi:hypothetical protein
MSEFSTLVQEYYKNPVNNSHMSDAMISRHEWNAVCGDDITIYMKFKTPEKNILSDEIFVVSSALHQSNDWELINYSTMAGENLPTLQNAGCLQSTISARTYDWNVSMVKS